MQKSQCTATPQGSAKKKFVEHINMESSFEDLVATRLAVKTDLDLDARFERYFIFRI